MRSYGLKVLDGIDQNLISRMQQRLVSVSMYSSMVSHATRQGIYHHRLHWSGRSLCPSRPAKPTVRRYRDDSLLQPHLS